MIGPVCAGASPSCLAVNAAGNRLYSAHETDRVGPGKHGTVAAWSIDRATGDLAPLGSVASGGAGPTYVSLHPDGKHLLSAGRDTVVRIWSLADGKLVKELGKPRGGQFKDWIHALSISSDGTRLAAADMATFFAVLLVGFAYVWNRGDLDWVRATSTGRGGKE